MPRILGIESSCDETAVALLKSDGVLFDLEKSLVASQVNIHAKYGGVVPEVAARQHAEVLFPLLVEAGVPKNGAGIDAIAVTYGPGLAPALRIGVEAAKMLSWLWSKPLVPVNHLEGHIYSAWLGAEVSPELPALVLIISGGHTEWILMKDHGDYEILGQTRDDAAGEAFDKTAKLLGLGYPGGPALSKLAELGDSKAIDFPRAMLRSGDLDVSFSGLKTAVSVYLQKNPDSPKENIAASFQAAVVDTLLFKTREAINQTNPKSLIVAGGVSANLALRSAMEKTAKQMGISFFAPSLEFTGDNAAMIAAAGAMRFASQKYNKDTFSIIATPGLRM